MGRTTATSARSCRRLVARASAQQQHQEHQQQPAAVTAVGPDGQVVGPRPWKPEAEVPGMTAYLDSLRWSKDGLVPVIAQVRVCQRWFS
jgi:hypothetical protein